MKNKIVQLWRDYKYHRLANKAETQLGFHSNHELKDIGITRADISRMAHKNCGWCDKPKGIREMTAGERQASRDREALNNLE
tara:strand:+ start:1156 stop:1401 length:246 start_codon:yes stop_codon:yes gene_type:complete